MLHDTPLRSAHAQYARALADSSGGGGGAGGGDGGGEGSSSRPGAATGQKVAADIEYIPFGVADEQGGPTCEVIASFGEVEPEYAAIRRGAGLFDSPHRGTIQVTGKDRHDFLNRMLTQELKDLVPGIVRQAFWLNRKGRIEADLMVIELGDRTLIDVDIHQAARTVATLSEFLFAEDVEIKDVSDHWHHIAVHGKLAPQVMAECGFARDRVVVARRDQTGESGFELMVPIDQVLPVWTSLLAADAPLSQGKRRVRPIGWHAFNIARIEAGTPLFNIDFGSTNLSHETGILHERVSFTKGCYLGQEIVARMENLGQPKQMLVGLRMQSDLLPVAQGQVFERRADGSMGDPIGTVTSSTLSPMLGAAPIAFAMLKTAKAARASTVLVNAEGEQDEAVVQSLQFWPATEAAKA